MGACFSISSATTSSTASGSTHFNYSNNAKVVSINGDLRQYPAPALVAQVLEAEAASSSSSDLFICNSDALYFDQHIPALELHDSLHPNHIYFVLHSSKREQPLSASDMAALAFKATQALDLDKKESSSSSSYSAKRHRKYSRITHHDGDDRVVEHEMKKKKNHQESDATAAIQFDQDYYLTIAPSKKKKGSGGGGSGGTTPLGISRTGSVRRLQRLTSKRAKMAVRSFRLKLTTIYEGTILI